MKRVLLVLAAAALCVCAPAAHAKEDVKAHLETRLPANAKAGTSVRVVWSLYYLEEGRRRPFGASELFVQLRGTSGRWAGRVYGEGRSGRYAARVRVPRGGIRGIRFGLMGYRMYPDGTTEPAPVYFPLDNDPLAHR
jgi:hypothetical protein